MKTVLIADDEKHLRLLVKTTIQSDQYQVIEAADGNQAWHLVHRYHPEVALLDVMMPGMTGLDLAQAIRATPQLAGTKIIMLTAKAQAADVELGKAAGVDLYLTKPFSPLELLSAVEKALGVQ